MKTTISMLTLLFSMLGTQSLFAQVADSVFFQIMNIPTKQGKVLLITENGKHYGMVDATDSIVKIKLNDLPYGRYVYIMMPMVIGSLTSLPITYQLSIVQLMKLM
ncbi:hypothetical protein [uncultured Phocaeicola sp.]|uniref:hypothetical protein n=1 Tax=uncultured Phocaeicola sp. TaxID=990718 RepID=UPI002605392D|nr:hypothetical protein [uncultured Phocaeicola sp.]